MDGQKEHVVREAVDLARPTLGAKLYRPRQVLVHAPTQPRLSNLSRNAKKGVCAVSRRLLRGITQHIIIFPNPLSDHVQAQVTSRSSLQDPFFEGILRAERKISTGTEIAKRAVLAPLSRTHIDQKSPRPVLTSDCLKHTTPSTFGTRLDKVSPNVQTLKVEGGVSITVFPP